MKNHLIHILENARGQVALFVALIFQVLFIFFAMIVNVGLLVHHKINLQNSVDLAAYYGAMKQAEMMNAIAHVNYQIRQSWKLMTFRYQQLGAAGIAGSVNTVYPYSSANRRIVQEDDVPLPYSTAFCVPYTPINLVRGNGDPESYCWDPELLQVPLPGIPQIANASLDPANVFNQVQYSIRSTGEAMREMFVNKCQEKMSDNWFQLAKFINAYKFDIRSRKKLLLALSAEISKADPRDIQGESIREGVYKTLIRNLTYPNREEIQSKFGANGTGNGNQEIDFKFLNSLAIGDCGGGSPTEPPGWLKEILVFPMYAAIDGTCGANDAVTFEPVFFNNGPVTIGRNVPQQRANEALVLAQVATDLPPMNAEQRLLRSSVGFEKNPWCVGYVGVSAKTSPKIPFSPFGTVTLKATAFAKPFGGRIGPWYGTKWDRSADKSGGSERTDALIPVRVDMTQNVGVVGAVQRDELKSQHRLFPNHSRYLGDKVGVFSQLTLSQFAKAIHEKMLSIQIQWYNEVVGNYDDKNNSGDPLAWDNQTNQTVPLRDLEIAAVAPDQFDTATYSIDPDFYNNYLVKIQKGYGNQFQFLLRGDLGSRMNGTEEQKRYSIRNQIQQLVNPSKNMVDVENKLTYLLTDFAHLLTSWQQVNPDRYEIDRSRFGICVDPIPQDSNEANNHTIGSCRKGGRTGYSVKLVDGRFLRNASPNPASYKLGGEDTSGDVKNKPPNDF